MHNYTVFEHSEKGVLAVKHGWNWGAFWISMQVVAAVIVARYWLGQFSHPLALLDGWTTAACFLPFLIGNGYANSRMSSLRQNGYLESDRASQQTAPNGASAIRAYLQAKHAPPPKVTESPVDFRRPNWGLYAGLAIQQLAKSLWPF